MRGKEAPPFRIRFGRLNLPADIAAALEVWISDSGRSITVDAAATEVLRGWLINEGYLLPEMLDQQRPAAVSG
jgi:hypothetical protein